MQRWRRSHSVRGFHRLKRISFLASTIVLRDATASSYCRGFFYTVAYLPETEMRTMRAPISHCMALVLYLLCLMQHTVALPAQEPGEEAKVSGHDSLESLVGPITKGNFADPSVMKTGNTYYAYATNHDGVRCPAATSEDFKDWKVVAEKQVLPELPEWAADGKGESVWGPDVNQIVSRIHALIFSSVLTQHIV